MPSSSNQPESSRPGPGPSLRDRLRNPERSYTGPNEATLPKQPGRTPAETEAYYARLSRSPEGPAMPRWNRAVGIAGWVLGGFACGYMILFADFGDREHVFQPLRRQFEKFTRDLITLSPNERSILENAKRIGAEEQEARRA